MPDPIDISGSPLSFEAVIDDDGYEKSIDNIFDINRRLYESEMKRFNAGIEKQREYNKIIGENPGLFKNLDRDTTLQLSSFQKLQEQLREVAKAKSDLNKSYAAGNTAQDAYQASIAELVSKEQQLATALGIVGAELAKSDTLQKAGADILRAKSNQIDDLALSYEKLSAAQQQGSQGKLIQDDLGKLKSELAGIEQYFKSFADNAFGNLGPELAKLDQATKELTQIARLENELANIPARKAELDQNFVKNKEAAQGYRDELSKLTNEEQLLRTQIEATKASLKTSDSQFTQNQKSIANEVKQLGKLNIQYAELSKSSTKTEAAKIVKTDIGKLEKSIARGQDQETKILEARTTAAAKLKEQYDRLATVRQSKIELKTDFDPGAKYITDYHKAVTALNDEEQELTAAINRQSDAFKSNQAVAAAVNNAVNERIAKIKQLEAALDNISTDDRANPEIGGKLAAQITGLENQLNLLRNNITSLPDITLGGIEQGATQIAKLTKHLDVMISELTNIPTADFQTEGIGELENLIKKITEAKTKLESLPDSQKLDITVTGKFQQDIKALESSITRVVEKILNIPEFSLGNLDDEKAKVVSLEKELQNLTTADIAAGKGIKLTADLNEAKAQVNLLSAALKAVPELNMGNVKEKIAELSALRAEQQNLKTVALNIDVDAAKGEINSLNTSIDLLRSTLTSLPVLSIGDVDKQVQEIERLRKEFNALPEDHKIDVEVGGKALEQIRVLESELDSFRNGLNNIPALVIEGISQKTAELQKLQAAAKDLAIRGEVDDSLFADIKRVESELRAMYAMFTAAPNIDAVVTVEGIKQAITQLDVFEENIASLKQEAKNIGININDNTSDEIKGAQARLKELANQVLTLPDLRIGTGENQINQLQKDLEALRAKLQSLPDATISVQATIDAESLVKQLADVKTRLATLSDAQKIDIELTGSLKTEIIGIENELQNLIAKILNVPDLSIGKLDAEKQKLKELEAELEKLGDADVDSDFGKKLIADIGEAKAEVNFLTKALAAIPNLSVGNVEAQISDLVRLRQEQGKLTGVNKNINLQGIDKAIQELATLKDSIKTVPELQIDVTEASRNLTRLRAEFEALPDAEKVDINIGGAMLTDIQKLESELEQFKDALTSLPGLTITGITERQAEIRKLEQQLETIPDNQIELRVQVKADIDKFKAEIADLKTDLGNVPELTIGTINNQVAEVVKLENVVADLSAKLQGLTVPNLSFQVQGNTELQTLINQATELKAKIEALPEGEKIDIAISGKLTEDLTRVDTQITRVVEKILNLPAFSLGNLDEEKQKLASLEAELEKLTDEDFATGKGDKLSAEIDQAEAKVRFLSAAVNAVPELTLGNVEDKINDLLKLKQVQDSFKSVELDGIKTEGIEQAVKNLEAFKGLLSRGITVPGIESALDDLDKLNNQFQELANIRTAKLDLTNNFDQATGDVQEHEVAIASLTARESELTTAIHAGTNALLKNDTVQQNARAGVEDTIARLESLKLSYSQILPENQGSEKALALAATIEKLKNEVEGLNTALNATGNGVTDGTTAKIAGVVKLKDEYRSLLNIQKEISKVRTVKLELDSNLKEGKIDADAYTKSLETLEAQEGDLIQAYQKEGAALRANSDFQKNGAALIAETTKEINKLKSAYNALPAASKIDISVGGDMQATIKGLEQDIQNYKNVLNNADAAGGFNQSIAGAQQFRKSIQSLQIDMQAYEAIVGKSTDPAVIKKYTAEIARLQKEIRQVGNAGKAGFDDMGRPIKEQLSLIGRLERAATLYKKAIESATNPDNITKYNRKLEEANAELSRMQNRGKTGFDSVGTAIDKTGGKLGGFKSMLTNVAGAFGLVGLADTLVNFGRELADVAVKASGIDRAFSRIGDTAYLEKLRKETKGFVSDFELERLTVKAKNLNIPLKDMGTYLLFASTRAKETGESVDKMTNDIVEGLGKESLRIIDNLGISQKAVREEMKAGGTMAEAVGRIMRREMGEAGVEVDTLADKTNKMSVTWDNAKKSVAGFFTRMLNPQGASDSVIGSLTQKAISDLGNLEKATAAQRQKAIADQIKKVGELSKAYEKAQMVAATTVSSMDGGRAERLAKQAAEELQAAKNVRDTLKEQNRLLEKKERINAGSLTVTEAEEMLSKAQEQALNSEFADDREKYQKQADEYTALVAVLRRNGNAEFAKLLNDVDGNFRKLVGLATNEADLKQLQEGLQIKISSLAPDSKDIAGLQKKQAEVNKLLEAYQVKDKGKTSAPKLDNRSYEQRIALLQKLAELETKYNAKNLTPDQLANEELQNEFKKIANEIGKFNRDPKNKIKIPIARLEELRVKATADLLYKQDTEKLKIELERQKGIFQEYDNFKLATNKETADERFNFEKKSFDDYGAYLESELAKIDTSKPMTATEQQRFDFLKKESQDYWESQRDLRTKDLQDALVATATSEQQRAQITAKYAKMAQAIRDANPGRNVDPEIAEINRLMQADIDAAKDAAFQKTAIYQQLSEEIVRFTRDEVLAQIEATKAALNNADISSGLKAKLEADLSDLEIKLKIGVDKGYMSDLLAQKKRLQESLATQKLSTAEIQKQKAELAKVIGLISQAKADKFLKIADALGNVSGSLQEAAGLIGKFDEQAGKTVSTLSEMAGAAGSIAAGFATGNPFAVISGGIGLISGFVDLLDKSDEKIAAADERRRKSLEKTQQVLAEMNRLLDVQARNIEKSLGVDKIDAYRNQLQLINKDLVDTIKKINDLNLKTVNIGRDGRISVRDYGLELANLYDIINQGNGNRPREDAPFGGIVTELDTLEKVIETNRSAINQLYKDIAAGTVTGAVEELEALLGAYEDLEQQLEDYKARLQEVVTGTTFGSIVDSIADGFRQGFKSAEEQAKYFADTFEDLMKNAIIQSLKMQALEKPLKDFYDKFATYSETEGGLTTEEIEELERIYNEILANAQKQFDNLQKLSGIDFAATSDTSNKNSLQGGIERMDQQTAEVIAGQLGGMRLGILSIDETTKNILAALLSPGALALSGIDIPEAGNNTFTVPGMLEVANNTAQLVGTNQQIALNGAEQVRIAMENLNYARQTAENTAQTAQNTRAITDIDRTLRDMNRKMDSGSNAIRANGG